MTPQPRPALNTEALEARFALRATALLTERSDALPQDISERLRVAREQAVQRARAVRVAPVAVAAASRSGGALTWPGPFGGEGRFGGWWLRFGAVLPFVALLAGLVLIQDWHGSNQISAAAEIDASLLADDLPPSAYTDEGFVEYLASAQE